MFKKMFASLGIGGARVETYLTTPTVTPGSFVQGHTEVRAGDVEQTIESLDIVLNTTYVRESDDNTWTEQWILHRQPIANLERRPIQAADRQVFAGAAGHDRVALGLERLNAIVGVQRDRPLRPAMEAPVALLVAGHALGGDAGAGAVS